MNTYYVYIITNFSKSSFYIWVTNNLQKRIREHKNNIFEWFTSKYNIDILVYYEECSNINIAISREKQLKKWSRSKKLNLVKMKNEDLNEIVVL